MGPAELRRRFLLAFWWELKIVWPILSALVAIQLALGLLVGYREGWTINDATYFTFVTGLTIGYGDLVPAHFGTRLISIMIGLHWHSVDRLGRGGRCPCPFESDRARGKVRIATWQREAP